MRVRIVEVFMYAPSDDIEPGYVNPLKGLKE